MTTVSDKKMMDKMELQIKGLEKNMGTIVKALKDIKASLTALEEKVNKSQNEEIQHLVESQKRLEEVIIENSTAIKRIDEEILKFEIDKAKAAIKSDSMEVEKIDRKCKYYNGGHCKHKLKCKYSHPQENCKKGEKCDQDAGGDRHPKVCKWHTKGGCRRKDCDYLHVTLACGDEQQDRAHKSYPCAGCKSCYTDVACVIQYSVGNTGFFLCLNCEDWIKHKENIITPGWSLFDANGDLRRDV